MKRINHKVFGILFVIKVLFQIAVAIVLIAFFISLHHSIGVSQDTYAETKEYIEASRDYASTEERLEQNAEFQERFDNAFSLWEQYFDEITEERQQILDDISELEAAHSQEQD